MLNAPNSTRKCLEEAFDTGLVRTQFPLIYKMSDNRNMICSEGKAPEPIDYWNLYSQSLRSAGSKYDLFFPGKVTNVCGMEYHHSKH